MWYIVGIHPAISRPPTAVVAGHDGKQAQTVQRLKPLDTLRNFMTCLVIYFHIAIVYGGEGEWPYVEAKKTDAILTLFIALCQSFFMAAFFVISGYFSAASLKRVLSRAQRTGQNRACAAWDYFKKRLLRLGLPSVVYTLVFHAMALAFARGERFDWTFYKSYLAEQRAWPGIRGPLWYCATTLVFDAVYALHAALNLPALPVGRFTPPILLFAEPIFSYVWRQAFPLGSAVVALGMSPAYLPQYTLAYFTGVFLSERPQLLFPPHPSKWTSPLPGLALFATYSAFAFRHAPTLALLSDASPLFKRWQWDSAALVYSIWNELGFAALTHLCVRGAQMWSEMFDDPNNSGQGRLARLAFGAYIVHGPLCTLIPYQLRWLALPPIPKTVFVGTLCTVASYIGSALLMQIPGASKVL
ncbi:hypothetical protein EXIGLDRAFT_703666 [Exidia glandulosa HHB12029]|uniref:Acyltransferase 3 domain-containing protein n=1 Tax=Exidia glandulosa HHB12029 TaxID=1314781 RepID=A0A165L4K7_EXIGL|nr:hypothetical protein EXIGLDRAFT_703666 [Exidia glandulosa HHB12029]